MTWVCNPSFATDVGKPVILSLKWKEWITWLLLGRKVMTHLDSILKSKALSILVSSVCMPSSGIAGLYGSSISRFWRNLTWIQEGSVEKADLFSNFTLGVMSLTWSWNCTKRVIKILKWYAEPIQIKIKYLRGQRRKKKIQCMQRRKWAATLGMDLQIHLTWD